MNITKPMRKTPRRPSTSAIRPAGIRNAAETMLYALKIHDSSRSPAVREVRPDVGEDRVDDRRVHEGGEHPAAGDQQHLARRHDLPRDARSVVRRRAVLHRLGSACTNVPALRGLIIVIP